MFLDAGGKSLICFILVFLHVFHSGMHNIIGEKEIVTLIITHSSSFLL